MRINQWLVRAGAAPARRKADELVESGAVTINGAMAQLGQVVGEGDDVAIDGRSVAAHNSDSRILLYHKPVNLVSSHQPQGAVQTIFDVLPKQYGGWKTVGRLDRYSEGLMVLTNDGNLAQALAHPSNDHAKQYRVWLDKPLAPADLRQLESGVRLDEGESRVYDVHKSPDGYYEMTLRTGWNRQIRRTFEVLGYRVKRLQRVAFGPYRLGGLGLGAWREMEPIDS